MTNILLAEDNPEMSDMLGHLLDSWGYSWRLTTTGEDTVAAAASADYDLVIMDLKLSGGVCGVAAARLIRGLSQPRADVPILALTGGMVTTTVAEMAAARFSKVLQKPVLPGDLKRDVDASARRVT